MLNVAILDDYCHSALAAADWAQLPDGSNVTVFDRPLGAAEAADILAPFDVLCTVRERMPLSRTLLERLGNLKLIVTVGEDIANLDSAAATECGVAIVSTELAFSPSDEKLVLNATPEFAWGLMIATVRHIAREDRRVRSGGWQSTLGMGLTGRTLGLIGLGAIGKRMARYAQAFDMDVIAWSENLTAEAAQAAGCRRVDRDELFSQADIVSIHLVLSERTRGLVGSHELGMMKREAYLINTSRGQIVNEAALVHALGNGIIAGAGLDVFSHEPLAPGHPLRAMENVTLTPHMANSTPETMTLFFRNMPETIATFFAQS